MWLTFNRRLYWHKGWACGLQSSFILGRSPACRSHLLPLWPWVSFLTSLSTRFLRGGREGGHMGTLGGLNKTMEGRHFGMFLGTEWVLGEAIIIWFHRYISFFSDEAGMREGGDADFANLTVFQRAPPGLERVATWKPQNPETHFNLTIYPQVLDLEPDTKRVGAASSFFSKRKAFCGEGKNTCTRGPRRKALMCEVVPLDWDEIKSYFATKVLEWSKELV